MNGDATKSGAQAIWPWRDPVAAAPRANPLQGHKRRALIQAAIMAVVATLLTLIWHKVWLGLVIYSLGALVVISGFLAPRLFRALERAGQWLGRMVALAITWLLLAPFFYLCFAPAGLILRLVGKDPMARRYDPDRPSYWIDHKRPSCSQPYSRQY